MCRVPDERAATSLPLDSRGSTAGAPRVPNASGPPQEESTPKELQTAYVQDMLAIDPVVALGLRVASRPPATLEYVSIDEARADLRALPYLAGCLRHCLLWCVAPRHPATTEISYYSMLGRVQGNTLARGCARCRPRRACAARTSPRC